jgi:hypothetical protein
MSQVEDVAYVESLLPDSYQITAMPGFIRCTSPSGIRQKGNDDDEERWGYTVQALQQHFGERFQEIHHLTSAYNQDFILYLRHDPRV